MFPRNIFGRNAQISNFTDTRWWNFILMSTLIGLDKSMFWDSNPATNNQWEQLDKTCWKNEESHEVRRKNTFLAFGGAGMWTQDSVTWPHVPHKSDPYERQHFRVMEIVRPNKPSWWIDVSTTIAQVAKVWWTNKFRAHSICSLTHWASQSYIRFSI